MEDAILDKCYTMLRLRKAGNLSQWTDRNHEEMAQQYALVLPPKPDYVGRWLILNIPLRWQWRPEPSELEDAIVARFAVKHPPARVSFAGLVAMRDVIGPFGRPRPDNPCICDEGPPSILTEIEYELIQDRGGWTEFCHSKIPFGVEKSQYMKDYDAALARYAAEGRPTYYIPAIEPPPPPALLPKSVQQQWRRLNDRASTQRLTTGGPIEQ